MTPADFKAALLRLVYRYNPSTDDARVHKDAANATNRAFQVIWDSPFSDGYRRQNFTFTTAAGTENYTLDSSIQKILRIRAAAVALVEVPSRDDFEDYATRYETAHSSSGQPRIFYLERTYAGSGTAEAFTTVLRLKPNPSSALTVSYDATVEPPNYTACDLESTVVPLPMPHQKVESILLPMAAWFMVSTSEFVNASLRPVLEAGYQEARALLGYQEVSEAKAMKRETAA